MAAPVAGEIWAAITTSLNASEEAGAPGYGYMYKVQSIVTRNGQDYARLHMIGPPGQCGGFYFFVPAAYMDASANWVKQVEPIP